VNSLFKALNDPIRRKILELLKKRGDMSAGDIADQFTISKPSISHHLDILKQAGLIEVMRDGQFLYYSLNTTIIDELLNWTIKLSSKKSS
jgi:ArsR family transcriptional regulator, arsenate/arsenite/antimonite-responsive transcriptional repressor